MARSESCFPPLSLSLSSRVALHLELEKLSDILWHCKVAQTSLDPVLPRSRPAIVDSLLEVNIYTQTQSLSEATHTMKAV